MIRKTQSVIKPRKKEYAIIVREESISIGFRGNLNKIKLNIVCKVVQGSRKYHEYSGMCKRRDCIEK